MRYSLSTDKLVNMLVHHFLRGRKHVLGVQAITFPLQTLNNKFASYAKEKKLDATMTSQVMWFEWYLNRKFSDLFADPKDNIVIEGASDVGVPVYHENANPSQPFVVWGEGEDYSPVTDVEEKPKALYFQTSITRNKTCSFNVLVPKLTVDPDKFIPMISAVVDMYRLAGKTYKIKITQ